MVNPGRTVQHKGLPLTLNGCSLPSRQPMTETLKLLLRMYQEQAMRLEEDDDEDEYIRCK